MSRRGPGVGHGRGADRGEERAVRRGEPALRRHRGRCAGTFTAFYPFCLTSRAGVGKCGFRGPLRVQKRPGVQGGKVEACRAASSGSKLPDLAVSRKNHARLCRRAGDHRHQYGFCLSRLRGVSAGVAAYRNSVTEADLARNIDRELISYRGLARYYVITGKEDDGKAALQAEASLKDAIDQAMKGTRDPGAARPGHAPRQGIQCLHQDLCRYPEGQGRERAGRAEPADARRQHAAPKVRRSRQHRRGRGASGGRARRQAGRRAVSVDGDARQYVRPQRRCRGRQDRAGRTAIRRNSLQAVSTTTRRSRPASRKRPACWRNTGKP